MVKKIKLQLFNKHGIENYSKEELVACEGFHII